MIFKFQNEILLNYVAWWQNNIFFHPLSEFIRNFQFLARFPFFFVFCWFSVKNFIGISMEDVNNGVLMMMMMLTKTKTGSKTSHRAGCPEFTGWAFYFPDSLIFRPLPHSTPPHTYVRTFKIFCEFSFYPLTAAMKSSVKEQTKYHYELLTLLRGGSHGGGIIGFCF